MSMIKASKKKTLDIRRSCVQRTKPLLGSMEISFGHCDTSIGGRWRLNQIQIFGNLAQWHECRGTTG